MVRPLSLTIAITCVLVAWFGVLAAVVLAALTLTRVVLLLLLAGMVLALLSARDVAVQRGTQVCPVCGKRTGTTPPPLYITCATCAR